MKSNCLETDFCYAVTMALALEIWPLVKVMAHPWIMDNNCFNNIKIQQDVGLGDTTLGRAPHPWVIDNNFPKY